MPIPNKIGFGCNAGTMGISTAKFLVLNHFFDQVILRLRKPGA